MSPDCLPGFVAREVELVTHHPRAGKIRRGLRDGGHALGRVEAVGRSCRQG
jgi:hypothetical protein